MRRRQIQPAVPLAQRGNAQWDAIIAQEDKLIGCMTGNDQDRTMQEEAVLYSMVDAAGLGADAFTPLLHWTNAAYAKALQYAQIPVSCFWDTYRDFCCQLQGCKTQKAFIQLHSQLCSAYRDLYSTYDLKSYSSITRSIIRYIRLNLGTRLELQSLAEHIGFSPTYVSHQFKKDVGIPPMQYITNERVRMAIYLLRATDRSVQEIAASVGFTDMSYFSRLFRKITGQTPSQFRRRL